VKRIKLALAWAQQCAIMNEFFGVHKRRETFALPELTSAFKDGMFCEEIVIQVGIHTYIRYIHYIHTHT